MSTFAQDWASPPFHNGYLPTPTARGFCMFAAKLLADRKPGVIVAPPGSGKTMTLKQIASKEGGFVCSLKATRTSGRARTVLARIAGEFKIYVGAGNGFDIEHGLWTDLPRLAEGGHWLMIDEAQHLDNDALRAVLDLNDEAGLPILLAGNADLLKRTKSSEAAFEQVKSRLRELPRPDGATRLDVDVLAVDRGVDGREAYRFLYQFGKGARGGYDLRRIADLLREGRAVAGPSGPVRLKHLQKAVSLLYGDQALIRFIKPGKEEAAA